MAKLFYCTSSYLGYRNTPTLFWDRSQLSASPPAGPSTSPQLQRLDDRTSVISASGIIREVWPGLSPLLINGQVGSVQVGSSTITNDDWETTWSSKIVPNLPILQHFEQHHDHMTDIISVIMTLCYLDTREKRHETCLQQPHFPEDQQMWGSSHLKSLIKPAWPSHSPHLVGQVLIMI